MTENGQIRAGCYLRISSDPSDKREGVDRQREDTATLCETKGWVPAGEYVDNDRSASSGKQRPEWDRLLADIAADKIDAVAAWDQDRGWRMMSELEDLRKFFNGLGRKVHLATTGQGDIDLSSPTGIMMAQIKTAVSEHEIAMMKVRMKRAARQKAERGMPRWRNAFGYVHIGKNQQLPADGSREIDPVTGPLVAKAYQSILSGGSISDIARGWNALGHYGLKGTPWSAPTLSLFLRDARNAGLRTHNNEFVYDEDGNIKRGTWPPLVDPDIWQAVQTILNAPERKPGEKAVRQHLLTGLLWCGREECGSHLAGSRTPAYNGAKLVYACRACRKVSVRADHVEPLVFEIVTQRLADPEHAATILRRPAFDPAESARLDTEERVVREKIAEVDADYFNDLIDGRMYAAKLRRENQKLDVIKAQREDADRVRILEGLPLGTEEVVEAVRDLLDQSPDRYRAVVNLVARIEVAPIGKRGNRFDPERILGGVTYNV